MPMRLPFLLALSVLVPVRTAQGSEQTVASARVIAAARATLEALPLEPGTRLDMRVIGAPADAVLPSGRVRIQAQAPAGQWPRSRVAVPVRLLQAGHTVRTATVWFAVAAKRTLAVYAADTPRDTSARAVSTRLAEVNIAPLHGHPVHSLDAMKGQRLRHMVLAGAPVLEENFQPVPDVDARQQVTVLVRYGAIRMQTRGTALNSGDTGQTVAVLAADAESPVQARVKGKGVVEVAR